MNEYWTPDHLLPFFARRRQRDLRASSTEHYLGTLRTLASSDIRQTSEEKLSGAQDVRAHEGLSPLPVPVSQGAGYLHVLLETRLGLLSIG